MKKRITRLLAVMLVVVLTLTSAPLNGFVGLEWTESFNPAVRAIESGICGENLTWDLDDEGVLTISGMGNMFHYASDSAPWYSNRESIKEVVIIEGVTNIGAYALSNCTSLTSITIPDTVWSIGNYALNNCTSLTSVIIPDSVGRIGNYAFYQCSELTSVTIGDSVASIGDYAFYQCTSLISVTIPDSVIFIRDYAFYNCSELTSVTIGDSVTHIGDFSFANCTSLTSITIPDSVTRIGTKAFISCSLLASISIGDGVTSIGESAFFYTAYYRDYDSNNWDNGVLYVGAYLVDSYDPATTYSVKNGTRVIAENAFELSSLQSITFPSSVTNIGANAFVQSNKLTSITIPDSVKNIGSRAFFYTGYYNDANNWKNGALYIGNHLIACNEELPKNYSVKEGTKVIADGALSIYNSSLTSVTIPASVTSIAPSAFADCSLLTKITVDAGNTNYCTDQYGNLFSKDKTTLVRLIPTITSYTIPDSVTNIGSYAFSRCESLSLIKIPDSVTSIGKRAFYNCDSLTSITIPESITNIEPHSFFECSSLTSVIIPDTVTSIGERAFNYCSKLSDVYYGGSEEDWTRIGIDKKNESLTDATIHYNTYICQFYRANGNKFNFEYKYSDQWFDESSNKYNHELCIASAGLAYHAGTPDEKNTTEPLNAIQTFKEMDFDHYKAYGYADANGKEIVPTFDSIACIIGSKKVTLNGKNKTIVAVAVRGLGYRAEWGGNFNIGNDQDHDGFYLAAKQVLTYLNSYLGDKNLTEDDVVYWLTGYSRAAATANLVAARLTGGGSGYSNIYKTEPDGDNVFGYMFATPNNTTDVNAGSSAYNNIFNIINSIDIVPTLAPEAWGFKKYGVCYFLPAQEYTSEYNAPGGLYEKMQDSFYSITGNTYEEDFTFYEFKVDVSWNGIKTEMVATDTMGQMTYINNLTTALATDVLDSREFCVENYQTTLQNIAATLLVGWRCKIPKSELFELLSRPFVDMSQENDKDVMEIYTQIIDILTKNTTYTEEEIIAMAIDLASMAGKLFKHPNYSYTTYQFATQTSSTGTSMLLATHEFENYMSWLALVGQDGINESDILTKAKSYKNLIVNCPVNVNVYDADGTLVASIVNDQPVDVGSYSLSCYVDENGQKIFSLPNGEDYRVEMIATDTGSVNCSVQEIGEDGMTVASVVNFDAVQVETADVLVCDVVAVADDGESHTFTDQNGKEVASVTLSEAEIQEYTITVTSDSEGGFVLGGGTFVAGEFAQMTAYETEEYDFLGWYDGEKLVSTDNQFRIAVTESKTFTARFAYTPKPTVTLGDIDNDGQITSADARAALRAAVGLDALTENQQKAADADRNGEITSADARLILRAAVGLEVLR